MKKNKKPAEFAVVNKERIIKYLFFLILIPSLLYIRVVNYEFTSMDDSDIITATYNVSSSLKNITQAFTHDAFMSNSGDSFYRPMQTISYMLDAQFGGMQPWIYHFSNLLLHILTVIALFFFLKKIGIKLVISFLLSMLFAVHPLFTNAVAWIPARGDLLLCLFGLLSFITYLKYFENRKPVYLVMHSLLFLLAVFSKEPAVLLPVLILSYQYFISGSKFNLKAVAPFLIVWSLAFVLFFYLRQEVIITKLAPHIFGIGPFIRNLQTIPIIFGKFFFPFNLSTLPLFDVLSLTLGILSVVISVVIIFKYLGSKKLIVYWGAFWFLAFTIPTMLFRNMSADIGYEYFEYRVYLPIIGILVIIGILANETLNRFSINKLYKITLPVIAVYALITFIHTPVFTNSLTFFTSAIDANSKDALAFNSRGCVYRDAGNMELALADFDNSTKICPTYSSPYFGRADLYRTIGDNAKAEDFYARALNIDTLYRNINTLQDNAYLSLSAIKIVMNKNEEALNILKKAIDKYPHSFKIANNLGYVYSGFGKYDSAIICFNKAIETEPNSATYYNNRAKAKFHIKDYNGSLSDFYKALILDPGMKDAYLNRGKLKLETNDYYGAVSDLNTTLNMDSQSGEAYFYLGNAFSKINKQTEAENCWASAKKLGFTADK